MEPRGGAGPDGCGDLVSHDRNGAKGASELRYRGMGAKSRASAGGDHLELSIEGVIGDEWWTDDPVTGASVGKLLKAAPDAKTIDVSINSVGGSFFDGVQIYQLLSSHPARVTMYAGAVVASAASMVMMAGDEIVAHETTNVLIHRPWTCCCGNEDELRKVADDLATLNESLVAAYQARTGMSEEAIRELMIADRYMGAREALERGFVTSVLPSKAKDSVSPEQARSQLNRLRTQTRLRQRPLATSVAPDTTPALGAKEKDNVNFALVVAALGLSESVQESDLVKEVRALKASQDDARRVYDMLGAKDAGEAVRLVEEFRVGLHGASKAFASLGVKSADEAVGAVAALTSSCDESAKMLELMGVTVDEATGPIATAAATLAAFRSGVEKAERDGIIKQLRDDGKCTPAQENDLFPTLNLASLKAFSATAQPIRLLNDDGICEPGKWNTGAYKLFAEMTPAEQREMAISDPDRYDEFSKQSG